MYFKKMEEKKTHILNFLHLWKKLKFLRVFMFDILFFRK